MKVYDVPLRDLKLIADTLGIRFEGNETFTTKGKVRVQGRLLPPHNKPNPYQRISVGWGNSGRKIAAICWHGHRDFMAKVFLHYPDARITSSRIGAIDYNGEDEFNEKHEDTAYIQVGPRISPSYMCEACSCGKEGTTN